MNKEIWNGVIKNVFLLCGIRNQGDSEVKEYVSVMYLELKNRFSDEEIKVAARQIVDNEKLFGNLPPLAVWLRYCPSWREKKQEEKNELAKFLGVVDSLWLDEYYDRAEYGKIFWGTWGEQARLVLKQFSGVDGLRSAGYKADAYTKDQLKQRLTDAWNDAITYRVIAK